MVLKAINLKDINNLWNEYRYYFNDRPMFMIYQPADDNLNCRYTALFKKLEGLYVNNTIRPTMSNNELKDIVNCMADKLGNIHIISVYDYRFLFPNILLKTLMKYELTDNLWYSFQTDYNLFDHILYLSNKVDDDLKRFIFKWALILVTVFNQNNLDNIQLAKQLKGIENE